MKQLLHRFDTGALNLSEVPVPAVSDGQLLVETRASVISAGTERALLEFGRAGWLAKAKSRPDQLRRVLDKARNDGLLSALEAVRAKLEMPITLGYCNAGVVVDRGAGGALHFSIGERVVTNGPHSEMVAVPHTLAARIPPNVDDDAAAFAPLAAIALQGIRLAGATIGETVVVIGLGLIGQLTVQLLRASGCRVLAIDPNPERRALTERFGAVVFDDCDANVVSRVADLTSGLGADAVLLTLSTASDEPVHRAAEMCRKKGRIVLVGVAGLNLRRDDFYKKELSFTVSCSYGPGRYDPLYEDRATDYPAAYVRWTAQRNFEAALNLMSAGQLDTKALITHRFPFDRAAEAYDLLAREPQCLGVLLDYEGGLPVETTRSVRLGATPSTAGAQVAALIGAGTFGQRILIPAIIKAGFAPRVIVSHGGTSGAITARRFGIPTASTDASAAIADPDIGTVFIATRNDSHAALAVQALDAGKHVFVEKPLALRAAELAEIESAAMRSGSLLMVGFNRRFAPLTVELCRRLRQRRGPLALLITVNAGSLPKDHWTHDPEQSGGRFLGEACHFVDLARALTGAPIQAGYCVAGRTPDGEPMDDLVHAGLDFADGSTAAINYLATGGRAFPKERIEAFFDGHTYVIENWRRLRRYGGGLAFPQRRHRQDKGHEALQRAWLMAVQGRAPVPIPLSELLEVSDWTLRLAHMVRGGEGHGG